jgi:hypothetical protein
MQKKIQVVTLLAVLMVGIYVAKNTFAWGASGHVSVSPGKDVKIGEVLWQGSFAKAQEQARKENKPILLFHLFGKLNEEFC